MSQLAIYAGRPVNDVKVGQIKKLSLNGVAADVIGKIVGLETKIVEAVQGDLVEPALLEQFGLPSTDMTYADFAAAVSAGRQVKTAQQGDKASQIYELFLDRVREELNSGVRISMRSLLEGVRILKDARNPEVAISKQEQAAGNVYNVSAVRSVQITLNGTDVGSVVPVLDGASNVVGVQNGDSVQTLKNMDASTLRQLANVMAVSTSKKHATNLRKAVTDELPVITDKDVLGNLL